MTMYRPMLRSVDGFDVEDDDLLQRRGSNLLHYATSEYFVEVVVVVGGDDDADVLEVVGALPLFGWNSNQNTGKRLIPGKVWKPGCFSTSLQI